jgi:hypothetical protein
MILSFAPLDAHQGAMLLSRILHGQHLVNGLSDCRSTTVFMISSRIPAALTFSGVVISLNPVQRMIGMSGRIFSSSPLSAIPVMPGMV